METVALEGVTLAVDVAGDEGRPWILLSNSLGSTRGMWDPQMEMLTARYRVLRYDTRGHGGSGAPPAPYALDDLCADAVGLMDHFGIARADLMGLSLGGTTALGLGLDHAERIGRIVCCDAASRTGPEDVERWDRRITAIREGGVAPLTDELLGRWYTEAFRESHPEAVAASVEMMLATAPEGYIGCAEALKSIAYFDRLGEMAAPVLYVVGRQDGVGPENVARMAERTPGSELAVIDPGAHLPNVENPLDFNAAVAAWLDRP